MKISFSQLGKHGRLGNQLFQIASTLGMAEKYGGEAVFPNWSYENYFDPIPHGVMQTRTVSEKHFHHYDWELTGDCDLFGYLQSEKYFGTTRLKLKDEFVQECKARAETLRSAPRTNAGTSQGDKLFDKETICIQVRRGDYVGNPAYYQMPVTFYIDALLTHFPNWRGCNILFTSDDIEYCRTHFECMPNAFFSTPLSALQTSPQMSAKSGGNLGGERGDILDMALASCCDHFIISNSSFGWWCAWFGEKPHSKIIYPEDCFAGKLSSHDTRDYRPERWIGHKRDSYKIPLKDVTFTIPVFFDHADRKTNLDLVLHLLQLAFDTNFIICEQGGKKFEYTSQWVEYIRSEEKFFHRTKMLNDMCNLASTKFIANWDCDVIIPPMQILMAVEQLRAGADMVFPYDGRFARMPRVPWYGLIQKHLDIGIVRNEKFKGGEADHNSVGGAVMFNKASFIEGGMENQHIISFVPEDCERNDRFKMLGFDVRRTPGALFHLHHFVGVNSNGRHPHFKDNHQELEKMRKMTRDEMRAYVDTWSWARNLQRVKA